MPGKPLGYFPASGLPTTPLLSKQKSWLDEVMSRQPSEGGNPSTPKPKLEDLTLSDLDKYKTGFLVYCEPQNEYFYVLGRGCTWKDPNDNPNIVRYSTSEIRDMWLQSTLGTPHFWAVNKAKKTFLHSKAIANDKMDAS